MTNSIEAVKTWETLIDAIKVFTNKAWQAADDTASGYTDEDGEKVVQTSEASFIEFSLAMETLDNLLFEMSGSSTGWLGWRTKQALLAVNTDLSQVLKGLERLEKLEEFRASIIEHYPNQDLDHLDFRLNAYRHALALEEEHSHE